MKSTFSLATLAAALGACFYEVGDLEPLGSGGAEGSGGSGAETSSTGGNGGGKVGASTGSSAASSSAIGSSATASSSAGGGDGGSGGAAPLTFLSCRQDAQYHGVCAGDGGHVLVWHTEVPVDVQTACEAPQAANPRCLVRHCAEESAGACDQSNECGSSGVNHGLTCVGDPNDRVPPSAIYDCSLQGPKCIGNVAVKPDPGDSKNCLFRDCTADSATCAVVGGAVTCLP